VLAEPEDPWHTATDRGAFRAPRSSLVCVSRTHELKEPLRMCRLVLTSIFLTGLFGFSACSCGKNPVGEGEGEGEGAGEGEGEGEGCAARTLPCKVDLGTATAPNLNGQGNCCSTNDVCVPLDNQAATGTVTGACAQKCGDFTIQNGTVTNITHSLTGACDDATLTCQTVTPLPSGAFVSVACIAPATDPNGACRDIVNNAFNPPEQACPNNESCEITSSAGQGQTGFGSFNCKLSCDPTNAATVTACDAVVDQQGKHEHCLQIPGDIPGGLAEQQDAQGNPIFCGDQAQGAGNELADCATNPPGANCTCDATKGFKCGQLTFSDNTQKFVCFKNNSNCAIDVPPTTEAYFAANPTATLGSDPNQLCNQIDDSRYCDQSMFDGVDPAKAGFDQCVGISRTSNDGICFALCATPAFDGNKDGTISSTDTADSVGFKGECSAGFTCSNKLALSIGFVNDIHDAAGNTIPCTCPVNTPNTCTQDSDCLAQEACVCQPNSHLVKGTGCVCDANFIPDPANAGACKAGTGGGDSVGAGTCDTKNCADATECGPGDAFCVNLGGNTGGAACRAPFSSCEPTGEGEGEGEGAAGEGEGEGAAGEGEGEGAAGEGEGEGAAGEGEGEGAAGEGEGEGGQ
jgi:hypothetical protein